MRSGVADYAAENLEALARLGPAEGGPISPTRYAPADAARALEAGHDVLLFQLGNDPVHAPSVEALLSAHRTTPAVVVLHDFVLHHLFAAAYLDTGRVADYARELERAHGERGRRLGQRALAGEKVPVWDLDPWAYPMSAGLLRAASAVVVHSRLVLGAVLRECPRAHVVEVPHHVVPAPHTPRLEARRWFGLPAVRPVVVSLGFVTPAKRIDRALEALALLAPGERPLLVVGGSVAKDDPLMEKARALEVSADVVFTGYLDGDAFWRAASTADAALNLRFPTMGETSGAVCRLVGFGLPMIVSDVGWFRELPDAFAEKVPVGDGEVAALAEALGRVAREPGRCAERGAAARAWGEERAPARTAAMYASVLRDAASGRSAALGIRSTLAAELHALGIGRAGALGSSSREADGEVLTQVARRSAELLSPRGT